MSTQTTLSMTETLKSVKIYYKDKPMEGDWNSFSTYTVAIEELRKNLRPGEWKDYSIVVVKSVEKVYRFVEGR